MSYQTTIKVNCIHCDELITFDCYKKRQECADCADAPLADFTEPDYGGAFDGFTVTSDADPGL